MIAAQKIGCVGPFSNYANNFLDIVFTAMFGFVGEHSFFPPHSTFSPVVCYQNFAGWKANRCALCALPALDVILFFCTAMILKRRAEQVRYRHIDEKNAFNTI